MTTPNPADTLSGALAISTDWDPPTLASLHDDGEPLTDLRTEHYTEQVIAALHGDPAVLTLDPVTQEAIGNVSRVFEHIAQGMLTGRDPKAITRRAAVLLTADPRAGTPMRCPDCARIHRPLAGAPDWDVAGREDIACPPCWAARPKHAAKAPAKTAPKAAAGTRRRRPSQARKAVTGGKP